VRFAVGIPDGVSGIPDGASGIPDARPGSEAACTLPNGALRGRHAARRVTEAVLDHSDGNLGARWLGRLAIGHL
jgi:hypothetical protein